MKILSILFFMISMLSCINKGDQKKDVNVSNIQENQDTINTKSNDIGYKLVKQYCYVCHMPESKENMIGPPLFRVKEHYKPVYENKKDFVKAITKWVKSPDENDILMPGTVRKFGLMPPQSYISDDTIKIIAEYIFENEIDKPNFFGNGNHDQMRKRNRGGNMEGNAIQLNNGKKWKVSKSILLAMLNAKVLVNNFSGKTIEDFNKFGKDVFNESKIILLDKNNTGAVWDELHNYFSSMENEMHKLMTVKDIDEAKLLTKKITNKINRFDDFFE